MPSETPKQARLMESAKRDPQLRRKMGMTKAQVDEWVAADRAKARSKPKRGTRK